MRIEKRAMKEKFDIEKAFAKEYIKAKILLSSDPKTLKTEKWQHWNIDFSVWNWNKTNPNAEEILRDSYGEMAEDKIKKMYVDFQKDPIRWSLLGILEIWKIIWAWAIAWATTVLSLWNPIAWWLAFTASDNAISYVWHWVIWKAYGESFIEAWNKAIWLYQLDEEWNILKKDWKPVFKKWEVIAVEKFWEIAMWILLMWPISKIWGQATASLAMKWYSASIAKAWWIWAEALVFSSINIPFNPALAWLTAYADSKSLEKWNKAFEDSLRSSLSPTWFLESYINNIAFIWVLRLWNKLWGEVVSKAIQSKALDARYKTLTSRYEVWIAGINAEMARLWIWVAKHGEGYKLVDAKWKPVEVLPKGLKTRQMELNKIMSEIQSYEVHGIMTWMIEPQLFENKWNWKNAWVPIDALRRIWIETQDISWEDMLAKMRRIRNDSHISFAEYKSSGSKDKLLYDWEVREIWYFEWMSEDIINKNVIYLESIKQTIETETEIIESINQACYQLWLERWSEFRKIVMDYFWVEWTSIKPDKFNNIFFLAKNMSDDFGWRMVRQLDFSNNNVKPLILLNKKTWFISKDTLSHEISHAVTEIILSRTWEYRFLMDYNRKSELGFVDKYWDDLVSAYMVKQEMLAHLRSWDANLATMNDSKSESFLSASWMKSRWEWNYNVATSLSWSILKSRIMLFNEILIKNNTKDIQKIYNEVCQSINVFILDSWNIKDLEKFTQIFAESVNSKTTLEFTEKLKRNLWEDNLSPKVKVVLTKIINSFNVETIAVKLIDISKYSPAEKAKISETIISNFPLVEIMRLIPWERVININIWWIKQINDIAWQAFTDKVSNAFREILKHNFELSYLSWEHKAWRIVKNDYKNITFVTESKDPIHSIFWDSIKKSEIIDSIIRTLEPDIRENAKNIILEAKESWKIKISSEAELNSLIESKIRDTINVVRKHFNFWVWSTMIPEAPDSVAKLDSIRRAEIVSRPGEDNLWDITLKEYDHARIIDSLWKSLEIEANIVEEFKWKKFTYDGVDYNVTIEDAFGKRISSELLRYVRKYPDKIDPKSISEAVSRYIRSLNDALDFIWPIRWNIEVWNKELLEAEEINKQIRNWNVEKRFLETTYKWWLTKEAFYKETDKKNGTRIFVDIKDMWIDNLVDFRNRARDIIDIEAQYKAWNIDKATYEAKVSKLFLESWKSVTDKFVKAEKLIRQRYPDALISFGWDEIFLFIPENWMAKDEISITLSNIFDSSNQKTRIIMDSWKSDIWSEAIYSRLDKLSKLNKIVEESIEKQLIKKWMDLEWNWPTSTYLDMAPEIKNIFMNWNYDIDVFAKAFKKIIDKIDIVNLKSWALEGGEVFDWVSVRFYAKPNWTLGIYLYNK